MLDDIRAASVILAGVSPNSAMTQDVKTAILEAVRVALGTDLVAIFTIDPSTGGIECESTEGVRESVKAAFLALFEPEITDPAKRDPWSLRNLPQLELNDRQAQSTITESGVLDIIACPIRSDSSATGILVVFCDAPVESPSDTIAVLSAVAAQASSYLSYAMAIEQSSCMLDDLAGANQKLSEEATIDGLTGLANHRTFQQTLSGMCRTAPGGSKKAFCLVMVDVDHFKIYNDVHGHQQGDAVLRKVAKTMAAELRHGDLAARYGGEEFALIFKRANKEDAARAADRIRRTIAEQDYGKGTVTVSMGVAEYPADGASPSELVENADKSLYHAKITGRDRVYVCGSSSSQASRKGDDQASGKTILVVEPPNEGSTLLIRNALSSNTCTPEFANSAAEATELLKTRTYDIALVSTDALPDRDVKALSTLSAIHPQMPIVLVAGDMPTSETREALRRGASDILQKPYNAADLPVIIERNLERQRIEMKKLLERSNSIMLQAIEALVAAIDSRDPYAAGHSSRVAALALTISDNMDLSNEERYALELAAKLHDIGKIGLPDSAFGNQSALTEVEWQAMREHPILGSKIVGAIDELAYVSNIIRHHHERLDGTGYPDGLRGAAIPLLSRIIAVADAYEAMTSARAHRAGLDPDEAIEELSRNAGTHYSEDIVNVLRKHLVERGDIPGEPAARRAIQGS